MTAMSNVGVTKHTRYLSHINPLHVIWQLDEAAGVESAVLLRRDVERGNTSNVTRHSSHVKRHTSLVTIHSSNATRLRSHVKYYAQRTHLQHQKHNLHCCLPSSHCCCSSATPSRCRTAINIIIITATTVTFRGNFPYRRGLQRERRRGGRQREKLLPLRLSSELLRLSSQLLNHSVLARHSV